MTMTVTLAAAPPRRRGGLPVVATALPPAAASQHQRPVAAMALGSGGEERRAETAAWAMRAEMWWGWARETAKGGRRALRAGEVPSHYLKSHDRTCEPRLCTPLALLPPQLSCCSLDYPLLAVDQLLPRLSSCLAALDYPLALLLPRLPSPVGDFPVPPRTGRGDTRRGVSRRPPRHPIAVAGVCAAYTPPGKRHAQVLQLRSESGHQGSEVAARLSGNPSRKGGMRPAACRWSAFDRQLEPFASESRPRQLSGWLPVTLRVMWNLHGLGRRPCSTLLRPRTVTHF